jgi:hypothetical protein
MPETQLPIIESGTPAGLCYTTLTNDIPLIAQYLRAVFSGSEINTGSSTPTAENRTKPWIRTNSDGTDDGIWEFYNGFWIQKHPLAAGSVILYEGASTTIDAFDGGETAAITNITGPFWEAVTAMAARSPIHPGTLASGTIINVGDNLGEEKHVMTLAELIEHSHVIKTFSAGATGGDGGHILNEPDPASDVDHTTEPEGDSPPDGMNVIHPVRGIFFIRRTARLYRRRAA